MGQDRLETQMGMVQDPLGPLEEWYKANWDLYTHLPRPTEGAHRKWHSTDSEFSKDGTRSTGHSKNLGQDLLGTLSRWYRTYRELYKSRSRPTGGAYNNITGPAWNSIEMAQDILENLQRW
eukprot:5180525-Pyramimonas_sp.AAC.1